MDWLAALGERMDLAGCPPVSLVICGGAALNLLGLVQRPTLDVDVLALVADGAEGAGIALREAVLPTGLRECVHAVARDLRIPQAWLNPGPRDLFRKRLPRGIERRLEKRRFGPRLTVYLVGRADLICLKVHAIVGLSGREAQHLRDLEVLQPTDPELEQARDYILDLRVGHDEAERLKEHLRRLLRDMGHGELAYGW